MDSNNGLPQSLTQIMSLNKNVHSDFQGRFS